MTICDIIALAPMEWAVWLTDGLKLYETPTMPKDLNLTSLRTFVTVAETGNFTRASERLFSTQSTVSMQIKRLEQDLGKHLFERTGAQVQLTSAGAMLMGYSKQLLALNDEVKDAFVAPTPCGQASIGVPESFAVKKLPPILGRFRAAYPDVQLDITYGVKDELRDKVSKGELDIALAIKAPGHREDCPIWKSPLVWAASPELDITAGPLPLVLLPEPCAYRELALPILKQHKITWRVAFTSPSILGLQSAALQGLGIAILPKAAVSGTKLKVLNKKQGLPPLPAAEFAFYTQSSGLSDAAQKLMQFVIEGLSS